MKSKQITPLEYSELYGCHVTYIQRMLRNGKWQKLPHVKKVKKFSRFFTLTVPFNIDKSNF